MKSPVNFKTGSFSIVNTVKSRESRSPTISSGVNGLGLMSADRSSIFNQNRNFYEDGNFVPAEEIYDSGINKL